MIAAASRTIPLAASSCRNSASGPRRGVAGAVAVTTSSAGQQRGNLVRERRAQARGQVVAGRGGAAGASEDRVAARRDVHERALGGERVPQWQDEARLRSPLLGPERDHA